MPSGATSGFWAMISSAETGAGNILAVQFHEFLDGNLVAVGIDEYIRTADVVIIIHIDEHEVGLIVTVGIIGYNNMAVIGSCMTHDAHTVLLKARQVIVGLGMLLLMVCSVMLVGSVMLAGSGSMTIVVVVVVVVLNMTLVMNGGHMGSLDVVGVHIMGGNLGLDLLGELMLVGFAHRVPLLGIIGIEDAAVPVEDTTGAYLGAGSGKCLGKAHVIAHMGHLETGCVLGRGFSGRGLASEGFHSHDAAGTHQDTSHTADGHGLPSTAGGCACGLTSGLSCRTSCCITCYICILHVASDNSFFVCHNSKVLK